MVLVPAFLCPITDECLGGSLGHVVGHHIKSGTERGANMTELNMMAKHMHAHVDVSGDGGSATMSTTRITLVKSSKLACDWCHERGAKMTLSAAGGTWCLE